MEIVSSMSQDPSPAHKKGRFKRFLLRGFLTLTVLTVAAHLIYKYTGSNEWHPLPEKDGVRVFWAKPPGTTLVKYKGLTRFKSSLTSVTRFMQDPTTCDDVGCTDSVVLEDVSPQIQYNSFVWDYKKPFAKRQFVVKVEVSQNPDTKEVLVQYVGAPDRIPANDCCIRVPHMNNSWRFKPSENGEIEVEYIVDMYEGGMIPYFVASRIHEQTAYIALREIGKFVAGDKYRQKYGDPTVRLGYIKEMGE